MGPRLLLIEDDRQLAEMLTEYLGEAGFRVSVAQDGRTGLSHLAHGPQDVLVLDLMLPDMDGLEGCRQLRATSERGSNINALHLRSLTACATPLPPPPPPHAGFPLEPQAQRGSNINAIHPRSLTACATPLPPPPPPHAGFPLEPQAQLLSDHLQRTTERYVAARSA